MSGQHAPFPPSKAARFMRCHGSVAAEAAIEDRESPDAALGTLAHHLAAYCLKYVKTPSLYLGLTPDKLADDEIWRKPKPGELSVDAEMVDHVTDYVETVRALAEGYTLLIEQKLEILPPDVWGTGDTIILRDDGEAVIIDLKYGRGVRVVAQGNEQLKCYALGVLRLLDGLLGPIRQVRGMIYQPRNGGPSEEVWTREQLVEFSAELAGAVAGCRTPNAPRVPGEKQCTFCRAAGTCEPLREFVYRTAAAEFSDVTEAGELGTAMGRVPLIEKWCKAVRAEVERRLLILGQLVPGFKVVEGRASPRTWLSSDETSVAKALLAAGLEPYQPAQLRSPAQMEDEVRGQARGQKRGTFALLWAPITTLIAPQTQGPPSVAPESDPRPALKRSDPMDGFSDVRPTEHQ